MSVLERFSVWIAAAFIGECSKERSGGGGDVRICDAKKSTFLIHSWRVFVIVSSWFLSRIFSLSPWLPPSLSLPRRDYSSSMQNSSLGVHISFVRSIAMDSWTPQQLSIMKLGGNQNCQAYLSSKGILPSTPIKAKYESDAAQLYKEILKARSEGESFVRVRCRHCRDMSHALRCKHY